jgi:hypothetical protein
MEEEQAKVMSGCNARCAQRVQLAGGYKGRRQKLAFMADGWRWRDA